MLLTNKAGLQQPVYDLIKQQIYKPEKNLLRVSQLIDAPLKRYLALKYWDEITADASEFFNLLLGTSMHYMLEKTAGKDCLTEQRMEIPIPGTDIVLKGTLDRYDIVNKRIEDWKTLSLWSLVYELPKGMPKYQRQQNVYRWMLSKTTEHAAEHLRLNTLLKDWKIRDALKNKDYPDIAFQWVDLPVWDMDITQKYINDRIKLHLEEPKECNFEEKMQNESSFAIKQRGQKNAIRGGVTNPETGEKLKSIKEAETVILKKGLTNQYKNGTIYIEERQEEKKACTSYCLVRDVCPYSDKSKIVHCQFDKKNVIQVDKTSY